MFETLKQHLDQTLDKLDDLEDYFEDRAEDVGEEVAELWGKTRSEITRFGEQLKKASHSLDTEKDQAALQVHLATMDARDQWETLKTSVDHATQAIQRESQTQWDEATLQAHLAAMDGRDFLDQQGKTIRDQYDNAREELERTTLKAAADIKSAFDGIIAGLPK